jgi:hypothetical protein
MGFHVSSEVALLRKLFPTFVSMKNKKEKITRLLRGIDTKYSA